MRGKFSDFGELFGMPASYRFKENKPKLFSVLKDISSLSKTLDSEVNLVKGCLLKLKDFFSG